MRTKGLALFALVIGLAVAFAGTGAATAAYHKHHKRGCKALPPPRCKVTLINHGHADNVGPKPPDHYSVSADFCQPSARVSCP